MDLKFKKKAWSRWYPVEAMTDANKSDELEILARTTAQTEFLLHSQVQAAVSISFFVNPNKVHVFQTRSI